MKLYWRYKKNGKWTWSPAVLVADLEGKLEHVCCIEPMELV